MPIKFFYYKILNIKLYLSMNDDCTLNTEQKYDYNL